MTDFIRIALVNLTTNTVVAEQSTPNDGAFGEDVWEMARNAGQYEYGDRYESCGESDSPVYALYEITQEIAQQGERMDVRTVRACPLVGYYRSATATR